MKYIKYEKIDNLYNISYITPGLDPNNYKRVRTIINNYSKGKINLNYTAIKINDEFIYFIIDKDIIYLIIDNINPYYLINSTIYNLADGIKIKENKLDMAFINTLSDHEFNILERVVEAIVENIDNDKVITLDKNIDIRYLKLILTLIPNSYLKYITYSYSLSTKLELKEYNNQEIFFDFKDNNTNIIPKRYSYTIIDALRVSIDNSNSYKERINNLIIEKKISIKDICDLFNLIDGRIERINSLDKISNAINNLNGMEYNETFIANILFTNINKFEYKASILNIFKFIYPLVAEARDYIIASFINHLNLYVNNKLSYLDYLDKIEYNAPFPLVDLLYYFKRHSIFNNIFNNYINDFNNGYLLLDLICRDLKLNNKTIVPNKELSDIINMAIMSSNVKLVEITIKRIYKLNNKGAIILLYDSLNSLFNSSTIYKLNIGYIFRLLENLEANLSIGFYVKLFKNHDNNSFIMELIKSRDRNKDYYDRLLALFKNNKDTSLIIDKIAYKLLDLSKNDLNCISDYYNNYYLDRYKNDYGLFKNKVLEYLNYKNDINECIRIYNLFFKDLNNSYKDTIAIIEGINNIICSFKDIYLEYDKYVAILDSINHRFRSAHIGANPNYALIKIGEELKKGGSGIIDNIITYTIPRVGDYTLFIKYYFNYLLKEFFKTCKFDINPNNLRRVLLPLEGNSLFDKYMINYFNDKGELFYFIILASSLNNKYKRLATLILNKLNRRLLKEYLIDYYRYIKSMDLKDEYKNNALAFIMDYIDNNLSKINKVLLKLKLK